MLIYLFYLLLFTAIVYIGYMLYITYGWLSLGTYIRDNRKLKTRVSIVIATRNEEAVITECLQSLVQQDYDKQLYEIIIIDDHSTDATVEKITAFIHATPHTAMHLFQLQQVEGKKNAIAQAIHQAKGELILTTDADCIMNESWLSTMVNYYETYGVTVLSGPVTIHREKSLFEQWQALELLSMIASGAATITLNNPLLCNGANFAYEKQAYLQVGGMNTHKKFTSGDDVFLLKTIKKQLRERIGFIKNRDAIVYTTAQPTLKSFISQRIRWISKSKGYSDGFSIFSASIIYLFNTLLFIGLLVGITNMLFLKIVLFLFILKILVDLPIMFGITTFVKRSNLFIWYIPLQIMYLPYVSIVGLLGLILPFTWKERKYKV